MKKIIALDFDGVLHPCRPSSSSQMLKGADILSQAIDGLKNVDIVITSTWRRYSSDLDWAISRFPLNVANSIVGCTPILGGKQAREAEIEAWIKVNLTEPFRLLILDDEPHLFSNLMLECLYIVNGDLGLCEADLLRVRGRLTN